MSLLWKTATSDWSRPGAMGWDEVGEKHPIYHEDEDGGDGHGWAANYLAHADSKDDPGGDSDADNHTVHDLPFTHEKVPVSKIRYMPDHGSSRTKDARIGYEQGHAVPPPLLVHRAGEYHVADGHHRAHGADEAGKTHIDAVVGWSPRTDRLEY